MICLSIQNKGFEEILEILDNPLVEMAEIRLDSCPLSCEEIEELFGGSGTPLLATFHAGSPELWQEGSGKMRAAVLSGAAYLDLEVGAPVAVSKEFRTLCKRYGTTLIRSYHDFHSTPDRNYLQEIVARCLRYGADIVKIVTTAQNGSDAQRVLSLYDGRNAPLIAFAMGDAGRKSRLDCIALGSPFTYACISEEDATAPGQWPLEKMHRAVYGLHQAYRRSKLQMPSSKSFAQRAILAAALAEGVSNLDGYTPCGDSEAAIRAARALGAKVDICGRRLKIEGTGGKIASQSSIDAGESGLLARLLLPVMGVLGNGEITLTGSGTLPSRPLEGAADIMASFGMILSQNNGDHHIHVPFKASGKLIPGMAEVSGLGGSQLISGLLMALPLADKPSRLYVSDPRSIPYMFITEDVLGKFGVRMKCELEGDAEMIENQDWSCCSGINFNIPAPQTYKAADFRIEADWSSAACYLVAGAVFGSVEIEGLDMKSVQADLSIIDVLVEAGASVSRIDDGGIISVQKAPLNSFGFDLNHAPDLFPAVAVLAAFCDGVSVIDGIGRLRSKESDRAGAIMEMLEKMGVRAGIEADSLVIEGENLASRILNDRLLEGGEYSSHHDHRMVMALSIASLAAKSPIVIDDEACVSKSFPGFRI